MKTYVFGTDLSYDGSDSDRVIVVSSLMEFLKSEYLRKVVNAGNSTARWINESDNLMLSSTNPDITSHEFEFNDKITINYTNDSDEPFKFIYGFRHEGSIVNSTGWEVLATPGSGSFEIINEELFSYTYNIGTELIISKIIDGSIEEVKTLLSFIVKVDPPVELEWISDLSKITSINTQISDFTSILKDNFALFINYNNLGPSVKSKIGFKIGSEWFSTEFTLSTGDSSSNGNWLLYRLPNDSRLPIGVYDVEFMLGGENLGEFSKSLGIIKIDTSKFAWISSQNGLSIESINDSNGNPILAAKRGDIISLKLNKSFNENLHYKLGYGTELGTNHEIYGRTLLTNSDLINLDTDEVLLQPNYSYVEFLLCNKQSSIINSKKFRIMNSDVDTSGILQTRPADGVFSNNDSSGWINQSDLSDWTLLMLNRMDGTDLFDGNGSKRFPILFRIEDKSPVKVLESRDSQIYAGSPLKDFKLISPLTESAELVLEIYVDNQLSHTITRTILA